MNCLGTWDKLRVALVRPYYLSWPGKPKRGQARRVPGVGQGVEGSEALNTQIVNLGTSRARTFIQA